MRHARPVETLDCELNLSRPASGVGALQQNAGNLAVQRFLQPEFLQARRTRQANDRDSEVTDLVMPAEPETSSGAQSIAPEPTRPIEQKRVISRMASRQAIQCLAGYCRRNSRIARSIGSARRQATSHPFPPDHQRRRAQLKRLKGRKLPRRPAPMKRRRHSEKDTAHQAVVAQVGIRGEAGENPHQEAGGKTRRNLTGVKSGNPGYYCNARFLRQKHSFNKLKRSTTP